MPGRGTCGKVKGEVKSRSSRAGLQLPVSRIHRLLSELVSETSGVPVYLATVTGVSSLSCRRTLKIVIHGGQKN